MTTGEGGIVWDRAAVAGLLDRRSTVDRPDAVESSNVPAAASKLDQYLQGFTVAQ
jgi:hypothetical protein